MRHELIGQPIEIVASTHKELTGIKGLVIDETKHTLVIDHEGTHKRILKHTTTFKVDEKMIEGTDIRFAPEERIKKAKTKVRKEWHT